MNCKEGDLAMFVGCKPVHPADLPYIGRVVLVGKPITHSITGAPGWYVSPPLDHTKCLDAALRPIRDPGDRAA